MPQRRRDSRNTNRLRGNRLPRGVQHRESAFFSASAFAPAARFRRKAGRLRRA